MSGLVTRKTDQKHGLHECRKHSVRVRITHNQELCITCRITM